MKAERRHELQHNEVADWVAATIERVKPYSRAIAAVAVAGSVLLIAYVVLSGRSEKKRSVAWNDYYQAVQAESKDVAADLETVAREHSGVPAGLWAEVALADLKLGEGIESLFREKQAAQGKLRSAIQHYQKALDEAEDALLVARARFGLARAYESLGQLGEAREVYEQVVASTGTNAYTSVAKERLNDLKRSSTQDFYAWFAKQEPVSLPPPSDSLPGTPGEKLPFDSSSISSPSGSGSFLDLPPLDKGTTGPLLTPQVKPDEKGDKDATDQKSNNEESDKDEKKEANKEDTGKENNKDDAAKVEDKAGKEKAANDKSTTDEKNAASKSEQASEISTDQAKDGNQ